MLHSLLTPMRPRTPNCLGGITRERPSDLVTATRQPDKCSRQSGPSVSLCDIKLSLMTSPRNSADAGGTEVQTSETECGFKFSTTFWKVPVGGTPKACILFEIKGAPSKASTLCTQGALLDGRRVARQPVGQRSAQPFLIELHKLFSILLPDSALWSRCSWEAPSCTRTR